MVNLHELGYRGKIRVCMNCVNKKENINGMQRASSLGEKEVNRKSGLLFATNTYSLTSSLVGPTNA